MGVRQRELVEKVVKEEICGWVYKVGCLGRVREVEERWASG